MIHLAVSIDLMGDGLLIGAGSAVSAGLGLGLVVFAAVNPFVTLRARPASWQYTVLVVAAGLYTVAVFED